MRLPSRITGRQGRRPGRATARTETARSRWSLIFEKTLTPLRVAGIAIVITVIFLTAASTAEAKHRYHANVHPMTNYLHRCLGIGWSDGYHAHGGWTVTHPKQHYWQYPPATHPYPPYYTTMWPGSTRGQEPQAPMTHGREPRDPRRGIANER